MNEEKYPFEEEAAKSAELEASIKEKIEAEIEKDSQAKAEAESNDSTLVKAAKALIKAISMSRVGSDRDKVYLLMRTIDSCEAIINWDVRVIESGNARCSEQRECVPMSKRLW